MLYKPADLTEQMLIAVAYKYGKNSSEYTMAGGVTKTTRKRVVRKPNVPLAS